MQNGMIELMLIENHSKAFFADSSSMPLFEYGAVLYIAIYAAGVFTFLPMHIQQVVKA
jgi:hypothetical protein